MKHFYMHCALVLHSSPVKESGAGVYYLHYIREERVPGTSCRITALSEMSRGQRSFNIIICFDFPGGSFLAKDTSTKNFLRRRK